jgi:hypothetical protein
MYVRERRVSPRTEPAGAEGPRIRIRPGIDVTVIDRSPRGLLIETTKRLLPGATLDLQVTGRDGTAASVRGRVVRCSVAALLPGEVRYRGAVHLDRDLSRLAPEGERDTRRRGEVEPGSREARRAPWERRPAADGTEFGNEGPEGKR